MKVIVNRCYGGYSLSPLAVKRLAELEGKECYFFKVDGYGNNSKYTEVTLEEASNNILFIIIQ